MLLQRVLRFRSPVFLRGPPVHGVVAHSVWPGGHPARVEERIRRSFASSHRPAWCSLAGDAQYLVPALHTSMSRSSNSPGFRWRRASHFSTHPVGGMISSTPPISKTTARMIMPAFPSRFSSVTLFSEAHPFISPIRSTSNNYSNLCFSWLVKRSRSLASEQSLNLVAHPVGSWPALVKQVIGECIRDGDVSNLCSFKRSA